jgi:hypothetical protein
MRKRELYLKKYGPETGEKLYHALQSQAAHAGVSARLRRKLDAVTHGRPWPPSRVTRDTLPLFPEETRFGVDDPSLIAEADRDDSGEEPI